MYQKKSSEVEKKLSEEEIERYEREQVESKEDEEKYKDWRRSEQPLSESRRCSNAS